MNRLLVSLVATPLILTGLAGPGRAQEAKHVDPVVVTATKIEESLERLGASVTVITDEDLRRYNYPTVGEALRQVPGVEIQQSGSLGKTTSIKIRGAGTQQVQVLIDGVRVKSPTAGTAELADIALDQIDRIEIVRGPQSTIYGADAIGGVVNIITKRGQGPFSAYASSEYGNYETLRERLGFSGSYKLLDYSFGASWFESNGQFRNDGFEQRAVSSRVGLTLPANGHIGLSMRYNRTASDLPFDGLTPTAGSPFFILDPDSRQQSETLTLSLQWDQKPVEWFEAHARVGQYWNQLGFQDFATAGDLASGAIFDTANLISQFDTRRFEAEVITAFHLGKWDTLTLGVEQRYEYGRNRTHFGDSPSFFAKQIDTFSYFLQDELRLFDRVILSAGRRFDDNSAFGTATTYRASVVALVKETGTKVRGTWGEGFRAPTINDLFFPGFGNPNLRPERSESWDAGVDQKLWKDRIRLGLTYFENKFEDLIQFLFVGGSFQPVNVARAWTQGWEVTAEVDILDNLSLTANYTHTDTKDLATGLPLRRFAPNRYNVGLTWDPVRALSLFVQSSVVSSQFEQVGFRRNPGYHVVNLGATWHIVEKSGHRPALDFTVRVNNATDETYMEVFGFRNLGINALAGLQARY